MKFSDLLGEPEPEREVPEEAATDVAVPAPEPGSEPITIFAPVPVTPRQDPPVPSVPPLPPHDVTTEAPITPRVPVPSQPLPPSPPAPAVPATPSGFLPGGRSGLGELNVRQPPGVATPTADSSVSEQLTGLTEIVDDLLPSKRGRK